ELFTRCLIGPDVAEDSLIRDMIVPLESQSGSTYITYSKKRTLIVRNNKRKPLESLSRYDQIFQKEGRLDNTFQVPLVVKEKVIGIFHINKLGGLKKLKRDEIKFTETLCEQLAIAVNNSYLYEQTEKAEKLAKKEYEKSEGLLLNILPKTVASELKEKGFSEPVLFENVSVLFTDFKGFTQIAEKLTPKELVKELDACFGQFDRITERYGLEKLKTIGDSYMCAGGIPKKNVT
ncbi:MAG: adenylate/guanylate cyclase domain-containing protein, partial [Spirochaetota bacterium]